MRKVIGPHGEDNTSAALAWLLANRQIESMPDLIVIGDVDHPLAIFATNYQRALTWGPGTFPASNISRGGVTSKIALDVQTMDITYSPLNLNITKSVSSTSPIHLAQMGYYENWRVRAWRAIMPAPGDISTYGCYEVFGGHVTSVTVDALKVVFHVNCWLDVLNQKVPANVIENTNVLASYAGAKPPAGFATIPRFSVVEGSDQTTLILDCTNFAGHIFDTNLLKDGWLLFDFGSNETLGGIWSVIGGNSDFVDGDGFHHNKVQIFTPLPWPPTPGDDTCFASAPFPVDANDPGASGSDPIFRYVPAPEEAM